jgi:hypothetical protein
MNGRARVGRIGGRAGALAAAAGLALLLAACPDTERAEPALEPGMEPVPPAGVPPMPLPEDTPAIRPLPAPAPPDTLPADQLQDPPRPAPGAPTP